MGVRMTRVACVLAAVSLVWACDDEDTFQPPWEPVAVSAVSVDSDVAPLVREFTVDLESPSPVAIDYHTVGSRRLRVVRNAYALQHTILVSRLVPDATYDYEVRAIGPAGELGEPLVGSFETDTLPTGLANVSFTASGTPTTPLVMLEVRVEPFFGFVALDQDGAVVWYWPTPEQGRPQGYTRRENGNFVFLGAGVGLYEVAADHEMVAELAATPEMTMHHDVVTTSDNTLIFLTHEDQMVNDTLWSGDAIWEWDPDAGTVEKRWNPFDFMVPGENFGSSSRVGDWMHSNSVSFGPRGNILVSARALDQVLSISSDYQRLEWRLGGPNSTFEIPEDERSSGQHTAAEVSPYRVLMFDNGFLRPEGSQYSRALELELDRRNGTARKVWEFRANPDNYARIISAARRLSNGNTLVHFGTSTGVALSSGPIELFEVDPAGQVVWHLVAEGPRTIYRAPPLSDINGETIVADQ